VALTPPPAVGRGPHQAPEVPKLVRAAPPLPPGGRHPSYPPHPRVNLRAACTALLCVDAAGVGAIIGQQHRTGKCGDAPMQIVKRGLSFCLRLTSQPGSVRARLAFYLARGDHSSAESART